MNPNWLFLIVPMAILFGVFTAYYMNTYRGLPESIKRAYDKGHTDALRQHYGEDE